MALIITLTCIILRFDGSLAHPLSADDHQYAMSVTSAQVNNAGTLAMRLPQATSLAAAPRGGDETLLAWATGRLA